VATGGLSRFLPLPGLWGGRAEVRSSAGGEPQYASALALGAPSSAGRDAWALLERRLQRWWVHAEGWEELRMNEDVEERITERLREAFPGAPKDDAALDLELLDVAVTR
jgi:nuclear pore complex protein Nup133